jgi:metallo-beta-lactamase class B
MKIAVKLFVFIVVIIIIGCNPKIENGIVYQTESLVIEQLTPTVFKHVSFLQTNEFGNVPCNGMIYMTNNEALVFDTPTTDKVSEELINWIATAKKATVKGVVINHFHDDCLGGLKAFHEKGIPSYANDLTIQEAKKDGVVVPENGFDNYLRLLVGGKKVINQYFGHGHSKDNIISYIPSEQIMFGGCMIKAINGKKGYLGTADVSQWPKTVTKVKSAYPNLKIVIPGHGKNGGTELLDYTIELFSK